MDSSWTLFDYNEQSGIPVERSETEGEQTGFQELQSDSDTKKERSSNIGRNSSNSNAKRKLSDTQEKATSSTPNDGSATSEDRPGTPEDESGTGEDQYREKILKLKEDAKENLLKAALSQSLRKLAETGLESIKNHRFDVYSLTLTISGIMLLYVFFYDICAIAGCMFPVLLMKFRNNKRVVCVLLAFLAASGYVYFYVSQH